jgi:hypothetical protein
MTFGRTTMIDPVDVCLRSTLRGFRESLRELRGLLKNDDPRIARIETILSQTQHDGDAAMSTKHLDEIDRALNENAPTKADILLALDMIGILVSQANNFVKDGVIGSRLGKALDVASDIRQKIMLADEAKDEPANDRAAHMSDDDKPRDTDPAVPYKSLSERMAGKETHVQRVERDSKRFAAAAAAFEDQIREVSAALGTTSIASKDLLGKICWLKYRANLVPWLEERVKVLEKEERARDHLVVEHSSLQATFRELDMIMGRARMLRGPVLR